MYGRRDAASFLSLVVWKSLLALLRKSSQIMNDFCMPPRALLPLEIGSFCLNDMPFRKEMLRRWDNWLPCERSK